MIGRLRGQVVDVDGSLVTVEVAGGGYEVHVPDVVVLEIRNSEEVQLLTRQVFREDGVSLYGFLRPFQRRLFDLLTTVKGCGPKVGLSLLSLGEEAVSSAILSQDARVLARATGVGARLAERIILELKEKMAEESLHQRVRSSTDRAAVAVPIKDELIEALLGLGYRRQEVEGAAAEARKAHETVEEQLRAALRTLTAKA